MADFLESEAEESEVSEKLHRACVREIMGLRLRSF